MGRTSGARGAFGRVRARLREIEEDIVEEFPQWPQWKRRARLWAVRLLGLGLAGILLMGLWREWVQEQQRRRWQERARVIQLISPVDEVREDVIEFVWRPSPLVEHYVVELSDLEYRLIWRSHPVRDVEVRLPNAVRQQLQRGERYLWQVRGFDRERREVAHSAFEEILMVR